MMLRWTRIAPLIAVLLGLTIQLVPAQDSVTMDVQPRVLKVGEIANCSITITGQQAGPAPTLPAIPGFELAGTSQQTSLSIVNGAHQSTVTFIYQLAALEAGTFQIGPFRYERNGQPFTLGPVEVTVVKGHDPGSSSAPAGQEDFLFATLTASRPEAYVQQPIQLELALYWRDLNIDREVGLNGFDTTGLRLGGWQELQVSREAVKGQVFEVRRFRCQAIPLTAGTFTLSPQLRVGVLVRTRQGRSDPFFGGAFDDLFFGGFRAQPTEVNVPALRLTIRDLPTEGRPPEFSGAIGNFRLDVRAQPSSVAVGEPVTMTARISGEGNLDTVSAPILPATDDFRRYDPKLVGQEAEAGQKTFELVLIPKQAGISNLPPVRFAFFDPETGRYQTVEQPPLPLRVEGQSTATRIIQTAGQASAGTQPEATGVDITHIKTTPPRWQTPHVTPAHPALVLVQTMPILALMGSWWLARRRHRLQTDHAHARRRQAPQSARRALAEALRCLEKEPARRFHEAVWGLLVAYFGNRFNLSPGEVSAAEVSRRLLASGWPLDRIQSLVQIFELCEGARFGAGPAGEAPLSPDERSAWRTRLEGLLDIMRACEKLK